MQVLVCQIAHRAPHCSTVVWSGIVCRLEADKERLQRERFSRFHAALGAVNGQLSAVYRSLAGHQGDAYLTWTQERLLCFEDGVTLNIRWTSLGGSDVSGCRV